jgi:predicted metalloprotease
MAINGMYSTMENDLHRKLIASTFVSLDGVMQAPGGPEEVPPDSFGHGSGMFKVKIFNQPNP